MPNTEIATLIAAIINPLITILSIILSTINTTRSFRNSIITIQKEKVYSRTEELPYELLKIMRGLCESGDDTAEIKKITKRLYDVEDKIAAYGSNDAVKICCRIQEALSRKDRFDADEVMASFGLLISQLKKDFAGEIILPDTFYRLTIVDYSKCEEKIMRFSNDIVAELHLCNKFLLKQHC